MARRLAESHGLGADDVIVDRAVLEEFQGLLYCLQSALEDIERDLAVSRRAADVADALSWLRENAEPLARVRLEPRLAAII